MNELVIRAEKGQPFLKNIYIYIYICKILPKYVFYLVIKVDSEGGAKMVTLKGLFNAGDEIWVQTEV